MMDGKVTQCKNCGQRSIVGLDPDDRRAMLAGGAQSMTAGVRAGLPSDHVRDAFLVVCASCHKETYLRRADIEAGGMLCHSCRKAPQDNWWAKAYGGSRNPPPPQKIVCPGCGAVHYGPRNVEGGEYALSWTYAGLVPDPKQGPLTSLETPREADAKKCCNYISETCIVREHGRCIVREGTRCGWWEKAVRLGGALSGRVCEGCGGEVPKRRQFCEKCRAARRRTTNREAQRRKRVSCQQSTAPTPPNCQEFEVA